MQPLAAAALRAVAPLRREFFAFAAFAVRRFGRRFGLCFGLGGLRRIVRLLIVGGQSPSATLARLGPKGVRLP